MLTSTLVIEGRVAASNKQIGDIALLFEYLSKKAKEKAHFIIDARWAEALHGSILNSEDLCQFRCVIFADILSVYI